MVLGYAWKRLQLLTAQNLSALVNAGVQLDRATQAREVWDTAKKHLGKTAGDKNLRHRKNAAYAWRQTIFYLSLSPLEQASAFVHDETLTEGLSPEVKVRAEAIIQGLRETLDTGTPAGGPFPGWVTQPGRWR